jgi:hypothetical protein
MKYVSWGNNSWWIDKHIVCPRCGYESILENGDVDSYSPQYARFNITDPKCPTCGQKLTYNVIHKIFC